MCPGVTTMRAYVHVCYSCVSFNKWVKQGWLLIASHKIDVQ